MIEADILKLINENLPAMAGDVLRKRLEQLPTLEKQLKDKQEQLDYSKNRIADMERKERAQSDLDDREKKLVERETKVREAEFAARVISLREQHATERVKEMREVVQDVFANAKYKYMESRSYDQLVPTGPGCAYPQRTTDIKQIEVQNPPA